MRSKIGSVPDWEFALICRVKSYKFIALTANRLQVMRRFLATWNKRNSGQNKPNSGQNKNDCGQNKPNSGLLYWQKDCDRWELTRNNCKLEWEKGDRATLSRKVRLGEP